MSVIDCHLTDTEILIISVIQLFDFRHISCRNENTRISLLLLANGASLEVTNNADEAPYDCIQNEHGPCGKAIFFNLQIRGIAGFPKYTVVCQ